MQSVFDVVEWVTEHRTVPLPETIKMRAPYRQRRNPPSQNYRSRSSKRGEIHRELVGRMALLLLRPSVTLRLPW